MCVVDNIRELRLKVLLNLWSDKARKPMSLRFEADGSLLLVGKEVLWLFSAFLLSFDFKFGFLLIELHKLGKIELGLLKKLDLSYENVLKGEDFSTLLLDFLSNSVGNAKRYN